MSGFERETGDAHAIELRARNRRLGLILFSIALVFFAGIVIKYTLMR